MTYPRTQSTMKLKTQNRHVEADCRLCHQNAAVADEYAFTEHVNIGNTVVIEDESGKKIKFLVGSKKLIWAKI